MRQFIAAMMVVAALAPAMASDDAAPVPMHIVTPTAEFVDEALQARIDSTKDLQKLRWDKKLVRLVDTPGEAVVIIEVVGRGAGTTDERKVTRDALTGQLQSKGRGLKALTLKLTAGDYSTEIVGQRVEDSTLGIPPSWTQVALDVHGRVEKWIKTNRAQLTR
jgi:hypothetical protein